jgi:protein ImuB
VPGAARIACCRVPNLPLAALLRASPELAGRPVAIASGPGPRAELAAVSPEAERRGVRRGTTVTHARSVCTDLAVRVASPALERAAREALLDAAFGCAPHARLSPVASGAWASEACAFAEAAGSEAGFAAALLARAERVGLPACAAVASSQAVARLAARQLPAGHVRVIEAGAEPSFLAPLPLEILDPDDDTLEALSRFGVRRVRDLLALPRRALAARLPHALDLIALARGEAVEPPLGSPEPDPLIEAVDLEHPVERLEPLAFVLQGLLSRLLARLEARHLACGELRLRLELDGGGRDARRVGLAAPTLELRSLVRVLVQALESRPPGAAVQGAALEAEGRALRADQLDLFRPAGPAPAALGRTLAALQALCGEQHLGSPRPADDHRPHRFELQPFEPPRAPDRPPTQGREAAAQRAEGERSAGSRKQGREAAAQRAEGERSPRLATRALRPPLPAEVRLSGSGPGHVRSAIANGTVVHLAGPWRTTGGWWSPETHHAYDHYDVLTSDGMLSRLRFDHRRRRWHIDAVYD